VTTIFDHHASFGQIGGSLFTIAEVAKELGLRACLCQTGFYYEKNGFIKKYDGFIQRLFE